MLLLFFRASFHIVFQFETCALIFLQYGQTGTGKSHTMEGDATNPEKHGIIPNSFKHIFDTISSNRDPQKQFLVRASFMEIYQEVCDFLPNMPGTHVHVKMKMYVCMIFLSQNKYPLHTGHSRFLPIFRQSSHVCRRCAVVWCKAQLFKSDERSIPYRH